MRKLSLGGALVSLALVFTFAGCGDDSSNSVSADDVSVASSSSKAKGSSSSKKGQADPSNSKSSSSTAKKTSSSSMEGRSSGNVKSSSSSEWDDSFSIHYAIGFSSFDVVSNVDKSDFKFSGFAYLEGSDFEKEQKGLHFTGVLMGLVRVDENGETVGTPLSDFLIYDEGEFPRTTINLADMDTRVEDPYKTECGHYRLMVYFYATNDVIGSEYYNECKFIAVDSVDFDRPEEYCVVEPEPVSSSSSVTGPGPELVKKEASVTTQKGMGFSFAKGEMVAESEADVVFKVDELEEIYLVGENGFKEAYYTNDLDINFDDDWDSRMLPPEPVHWGDFRFKTEKLEDEIYMSRFFFIIAVGPDYNAETGEDFYAVTIKKQEPADNDGVVKMTIIYYEKK